MGQQQLLLLVLGIVIVGIAILVGINAYSENSVKSNWDSLLQDALRIASDAQAWKAKPELFGGSPDVTKADQKDFTGMDFLQLAYSGSLVGDGPGAANGCYVNVNGVYQVYPAATGVEIRGTNLSNQNAISVFVDGGLESDIDLDGSLSLKGGFDSLGTEIAVDASYFSGDLVCVPGGP